MLEKLCLGADYTTLHVAALLALPEICEFLSTKFKRYASHKVLRLAVTGPQIVTRLLMSTGLLTIPGAAMDSFFEIDVGTTFDKVQETIRLVFSSGLSITDMSPGEMDEIITSLIERSLLVNPLFLVSAAEFILHTIDYTPQSLSLLPKAQKRFTQVSEAQAWRVTRCSAKETSRMESEFRSVTQKLSPLVADYPIVAGLCSAIWGLALHFGLEFTRDPLIVDTCISFSPEALVDALFTATYQDNLYFLEQAVRDPRLTVSELVRDDLSLLEVAVGNGSAATVKLLLDAGCSALPREDCAHTSLHIWAERKSIPSELDRESILCMLLQNGASTSTPNGDGDTAWHIASGSFPSLQSLLKVEDRSRALEILSVTNDNGDTALSSAFWYGSERCVLVFLSLDGINTAHFRDERPIFELAAELGSHSVTQKLIDMHWDPHLSDDNTLCPLHFLCPQVTPRCLGHLEILYGSTCHSRCGKSLLVGFIGTCLLWMEDEHASPTVPQTRVLEDLYRMDKAGMDAGNQGLLWDDVADLLANGLMDLPKGSFHEVSGVVGTLIQVLHDFGVLEAYEGVTGRSCLEPLFDKLDCPAEGFFSGREVSSSKYWSIGYSIGMRTWLRMLRWTNHWPALEHSEAFASFFRIALTRRSNRKGREVVRYMLERGVDVHVRIEGYSALERICLEQRVERGIFQQLLDGADP
ncbi:ankyrin repeat domain-containing protein, partial [Candidatus Bathyarchaeota archaeon]|nr:ankyrin repeat domain-containing protein [Candidatus Bathyarchaeota archaeon]